MDPELLIRLFNVGLGDCIYCRIPGGYSGPDRGDKDFHILIDCGSLSGSALLVTAVKSLAELLPKVGGKPHLDLLVVTHEHKDHMTGFGLDIWGDFRFGAIWLSAAMDLNHKQSTRAQKIHGFAAAAMARAVALNLPLGPQLQQLAEAVALNSAAMTALRTTLPQQSGIAATYVHADSTPAELTLPLQGAVVRVLGPENDIDGYYLGQPGAPENAALNSALALVDKPQGGLPSPQSAVVDLDAITQPLNIDGPDFRRLQSRMLSSALAFADLDGKVCNNTSVVVLIEWQGKRILFVGDAEWDGGYQQNKANCAWNVMWTKRNALLAQPVDFLKIGHHGSVNATPWAMPGAKKANEPSQILDAILPGGDQTKAKAVVSTRRGNYETIPRSDLLAEIGKRVVTTKVYAAEFAKAQIDPNQIPKFAGFEQASFGDRQPWRTDLEALLGEAAFIDVVIEP